MTPMQVNFIVVSCVMGASALLGIGWALWDLRDIAKKMYKAWVAQRRQEPEVHPHVPEGIFLRKGRIE
ncbi:MAG: hypothetical protein AB1486_18670 [Planctomycetota bacterium]